jgi:hypothetical protein
MPILPLGFFPDIWIAPDGVEWIAVQQGRDADCWLVVYRDRIEHGRLRLAPGS